MTNYPPMHPVSGYGEPKRKRVWPWLLLLLLPVLLCGGIFTALAANISGPSIDTSAPGAQDEPTPAPTKAAAKPKAASFGPGTYSVPGDIKPGTYVTTVGDNDLDSCYYARLSKDGDPGSIILGGQGVLEHGAHGRMTVKASDKGVQFMGACTWRPAK